MYNAFRLTSFNFRLIVILLGSTLLLLNSKSSFAQTDEEEEAFIQDYYKLPTVGIGFGLLTFNGDVGKNTGLSSLNRFKVGYNVYLEKRLNSFFAVSANGLFGKLASSELVGLHRNFETPIMQGDLNFVFHFDNGLILKKSNHEAPYFAVGISYLSFNPQADLKDKNGNTYNYWKDGSIRDLPEKDKNLFAAKRLQRDYSYETKLDTGVNAVAYAKTTFSIPITAGIAFKLNERISLNLQGTYNMALTDYLDNVKDGSPDGYFYFATVLKYALSGHHTDDDNRYKSVDYTALAHGDSDKDGVDDGSDNCPDSPKGAKVDHKGCPIDSDKDGIPDFRDKEVHSKNLNVGTDGVSLTDEMIEKQHMDTLAERHSAVTALMEAQDLKVAAKKAAGSQGTGTTSKISPELAPADIDNDGIISSKEISAAIDSFFEGNSPFSVEKLHKLIDFFFEQ